MIDCEPRQVWKEATVTFDSCAVSRLSQHFLEKVSIFDQKLYIIVFYYVNCLNFIDVQYKIKFKISNFYLCFDICLFLSSKLMPTSDDG